MPEHLDRQELAIFRDMVHRHARDKLAPMARQIDEAAEFPWKVLELFKENELLGLMFPEEFGGAGAPLMATVIAIAGGGALLRQLGFGAQCQLLGRRAHHRRRHQGAEGGVSSRYGPGQDPGLLCPDRAQLRVGCGLHHHQGQGGRRRLW